MVVWLVQRDRKYVALKIYVHSSKGQRELPAYGRITNRVEQHSSHYGLANIRLLFESFTVSGPCGDHLVLVFQPAQMSLRDLKIVFFKDGFDESFVQACMIELLKAADFLHSECEIIHTGRTPFSSSPSLAWSCQVSLVCKGRSFLTVTVDIHPGNILIGVYDDGDELFRKLEEAEMDRPVERKSVTADRTIYLSRAPKPKIGPMLLADFSEARVGGRLHGGDIMPLEYRAPEVLACIAWSYPVDVWSVALCVSSEL